MQGKARVTLPPQCPTTPQAKKPQEEEGASSGHGKPDGGTGHRVDTADPRAAAREEDIRSLKAAELDLQADCSPVLVWGRPRHQQLLQLDLWVGNVSLFSFFKLNHK